MGDRSRPEFHFSAPTGWINDPNGTVFVDGRYHLYYQYNPDSDVWGPMHWGHASSTDLVRWEHHPIALRPDEHGMIFSGSAVVDSDGVAGFGEGALVAWFTHHGEDYEAQSLAYSTDGGLRWTKHPGNPLLESRTGGRDFRDPRVVPFGDGWVMLVSAGNEIEFCSSTNLVDWTYRSSFADPQDPSALLEMPELLCFDDRWVLIAGRSVDAPAGGSGTCYWVGTFDGSAFEPDGNLQWADFGSDFYAAQAFTNAPNNHPVWLGWMGNWAHAESVPSDGWRGIMSVPRELRLVNSGGRELLAQRPVSGLTAALENVIRLESEVVEGDVAALNGVECRAGEVQLLIDRSLTTASSVEVGVRCGEGEVTLVTMDLDAMSIAVDRTGSGIVYIETRDEPHLKDARFAAIHTAPIVSAGNLIDMTIVFDRSSIEVFAADGTAVVSDRVFPTPTSNSLSMSAIGGSAHLFLFELNRLP